MPISVKCPSCGKTLSAPDSAAGKQAKCPACAAVMQLPAAAQQPPGIGDLLEEDASKPYGMAGQPDASAAGQAADQGGPERRPCPMCGELIVASAAKCHYCGAIFDPALRRQEEKRAKGSDTDATLSTGDWIFCILCAGSPASSASSTRSRENRRG